MIATPLDAAASRPIALRMRGDLEFRLQKFGRHRYWAVKDPVSLKYFHLGEEEHTLLQMLDGGATLESLKQRLDEALSPRRVSIEQVQGYLAALHRWGLVYSDSLGQGQRLVERRQEKRHRARLETLSSILAIRFPGVHPGRLIDVIYPLASWLFTPTAYVLVSLLSVAALLLVATEFDSIERRLPDMQTILAASNLPLLALSLAGVKVLHELGHAVAARKYGSDCHEVGAMLLVFTPCLYCNVSDSWMLPSKWHRIAIAAAGMYVELILAALGTFLWYFSTPGTFNSLCLNVVLICSLGTLLLNGNPLMRYDGYFIASDLAGVPNLRAEASAALKRALARYAAGIELPPDRLSKARHPALLASYAILAGIYRVVVTGLVLWTMLTILRPLHLEILVLLLAGLVVGGYVWPLAVALTSWTRNPVRSRRFAPLRVAASVSLVVVALAAAAWVPLPRTVSAPLVLEYADAERIYVTVDGELAEATAIGARVEEGQVLARLKNSTVELELARLTSERDVQQLRVANLNARRLQGSTAGAELPAAQAALTDLERRLQQATRDAERLSLVAHRAGTVLPAPNVPREPSQPQALQRWHGTPLDAENRGATLATGTLVCLVGDPNHFEGIVHIDERDVELVQEGQRVTVRLDNIPDRTLSGSIVEIARLDMDVMPRELAAAGDVPAQEEREGMAKPLDTWYQARVRFDGQPKHLVARMHGRAKIDVAALSAGQRLLRWLKQTFRG